MYYEDKNNDDKAIDCYRKAIAIEDRYPQPHHNMALIYMRMNQPERALEEFYYALRINPNFIYSLNDFCKLYNLTEQADKAAAVAQLIRNVEQGGGNDFVVIHQIITNRQ